MLILEDEKIGQLAETDIYVHPGGAYGGDPDYGIAIAGHLSVPAEVFQQRHVHRSLKG